MLSAKTMKIRKNIFKVPNSKHFIEFSTSELFSLTSCLFPPHSIIFCNMKMIHDEMK